MPKNSDPVKSLLRGYFSLDGAQKADFMRALEVMEPYIAVNPRYVGTTGESPTPKRGRPPGSRNKKQNGAANPLAPETFDPMALFAQNGAVTEDL